MDKAKTILIAEDDEDDYLLIAEALDGAGSIKRHWVQDGEKLMDFLLDRNGHQRSLPRPDLILLDLNMPRKNGREALRDIKSNSSLRGIPIIVFTTSQATEDVDFCYESGANAYIRKPEKYDQLVEVFKGLIQFWFGMVQLPAKDGPSRRQAFKVLKKKSGRSRQWRPSQFVSKSLAVRPLLGRTVRAGGGELRPLRPSSPEWKPMPVPVHPREIFLSNGK